MNSEVDTIRMILKYMNIEDKISIEEYILENKENKYNELDEIDLLEFNKDTIDQDIVDSLREYSGYNFRNINNALRDRWNYEENGNIFNKERFQKTGNEIKDYIDNNQKSIGNVKTYRGVNISYFSGYGVNDINDLKKLKDNYILDKGFVSTSLIKNNSFYNKNNDLGINYNVEITYLVSEDFTDGIFIGNSSTSYSPNQNEYLINVWNLGRVVDVKVESNKAHLTVLLIPKYIYDKYYRQSRERKL